MKLNNLIGIIYLISILTSCKTEKKNELTEKTFPVIIEEFSQDKLHHSDTTTLTIREIDSVNFHLFGLDNDGEYEIITDLPFEINLNDNSQILIDKVPAKLISEKLYSEKNEKILIKKYFYDIKNEVDEEGYFFLANNRIIAFNSTAWNLYKFYKYENSEIEKLLKKDTTDFFDYRNKKIAE